VATGLLLALPATGIAQPVTAPSQHSSVPYEDGQCEVAREWSEARLLHYWPSEGQIQGLRGLGYMGQPGPVQNTDIAEAHEQVDRIVRVSGLEMNFEMVVDPSTPAAAAIVNGQRVILFDPRFMAQVANSICPDWGAMSILAHEVGHHLAGHTLRQSTNPWRDELEADEFSGFVLARLGATLAETTSAAAKILPDEPTQTHPGRKDRIAAIVHGWQNAEAFLNSELTQARHNRQLVPMRQSRYVPASGSGSTSDLVLVARVIFYDDPNDYYITRSGRIDSFDGQRQPLGEKEAPASKDFAWTFKTAVVQFNVDFAGRVYMSLPTGTLHEVGIVVDLMPGKSGKTASGR
jgi:hypothetical protein